MYHASPELPQPALNAPDSLGKVLTMRRRLCILNSIVNTIYNDKVNSMDNDTDNNSNMLRLERPRRRKNVVPRGTIKMLSVREIARRYGFHENTVRRWVTEDGLQSIRYGPGNKIYIAEEEVENFIKEYYY